MSSENMVFLGVATGLAIIAILWLVTDVIMPRIKRRRRDAERAAADAALDEFLADEANLLDDEKIEALLTMPYINSGRLFDAKERVRCLKELEQYALTGVNDHNWLTVLCLLKTLRQHNRTDEHELYSDLSLYVVDKLQHVLFRASTLRDDYVLADWFFEVDVWHTVLGKTYHDTCYKLCHSIGIPVNDRKILDAWYKAIGTYEEAPVLARFIDFNVNSFTGTGFLKHIEELVNGRRSWDLWEGKLALALCVEYPRFREQAGYLMQDLQTAVATKLPSLRDVR